MFQKTWTRAVLAAGVASVSFATLASAQQLIVDGKFDVAAKFYQSNDKTGGPNSFDWAADAWNDANTPAGGPSVTYGFYTNNIVPKGQLGVWYANIDQHTRSSGGQAGGTDFYAKEFANGGLQLLQSSVAPAAGTRLALRFDYILEDTADGSNSQVTIYGMLKNNINRQPYNWQWEDPGNQTAIVPGPDMAHTWGGGYCTGTPVLETGALAASGIGTWAHVKQSFVLPAQAFDNLTLDWNAGGQGGTNKGLDNVSLLVIKPGDADEDGSVDGTDVASWAQNFTGALGAGGTSTWDQGDWNGDHSVDGSDVALWAQNFTGALGLLSAPAVAAAGIAPAVEVPEPASLALLGLGALGLLGRRNRR